jgi:demethylspheroidene O-methyltransferase
VSRRRARAALDLTIGFVYSQVLIACVELKLFDILRDGPLGVAELSARVGLSEEATRRLLDSAASLKLAKRGKDGRFGLGPLGVGFAGNPAALALVEHMPMFYADLADPVALLRGVKPTRLADFWHYGRSADAVTLTADDVARYSALMAASQPMVAQIALQAYDISQHRRLLDVGGGEGIFLAAAAERVPGLQLTLFDLPAVADRARERLKEKGLVERTEIFGGDFFHDPLPVGADVVTLVRVVHDHDDAAVVQLLRNVRKAMAMGATLLIIEGMSGIKGSEPLAAYFNFYVLAGMGSGRARRVEEIEALLQQCGFGDFRLLRNTSPTIASVLVAKAV